MATKEEELQKKREEAERKARRGEIDPTHEFTFQVYHIYIFDRCLVTMISKYSSVTLCMICYIFSDRSSIEWTASSWDYGFYVFKSNDAGWSGFPLQVRYSSEAYVLLSGILYQVERWKDHSMILVITSPECYIHITIFISGWV